MSSVVNFKPKAIIEAGSQPDPGRGQGHRPTKPESADFAKLVAWVSRGVIQPEPMTLRCCGCCFEDPAAGRRVRADVSDVGEAVKPRCAHTVNTSSERSSRRIRSGYLANSGRLDHLVGEGQ
jgi:hypothetical protein